MSDDTKQTREVKAKRTAKNSVFLDLFQDKKNLLKLYKTLHPYPKRIFDEQRKGGCDDYDEFI